ncbi:MAG: hypothetical protein LBQ61_03630 [Spirochaetales bacterium]|jgi:hypothetical protein|nr:hypothetical protein [Spirochaetales bacterium]
MKRLFGFILFFSLGLSVYAEFDPDYLRWKYIDNMPLREYNDWAGDKVTCSLELRSTLSADTTAGFDVYEFFQIAGIADNVTLDDDQFWSYILNNYEAIIGAALSAGDVNLFYAPISYFPDEDITDGYFLLSRYNGGNKSDPDSYRLFLYYYQVQWL